MSAATVIDIDQVQSLVDSLPKIVRNVLSHGPTSDGCEICEAFDVLRTPPFIGDFEEGSPVFDLAIWHTGEDLDVEGPGVGTECYLRCLYIYLCAGWTGQHND